MLVCNVSLLRRRAAIAVDLAEAAAAADAPGTGNVVFATLVDDPASVGDHLDAFLGQIMREAASAAATVNAGLAYAAAMAEAVSAADSPSATRQLSAAVAETVAAGSAQDATVVAATIVSAAVVEAVTAVDAPDSTVTPAFATWDAATATAVTLSGGNLIVTNTGGAATNQGAHVATTSGKTAGKFYFETTVTTRGNGSNIGVGIGTTASTYSGMGGNATTGNEVFIQSGNIYANGSNTGSTLGARTTGDVLGIAIDLDNRKAWFRVAPSGNWNGSGTANPATNTGGFTIPAGTMIPFNTFGGSGGLNGATYSTNFGASAFTGAVPSAFTSGWPV